MQLALRFALVSAVLVVPAGRATAERPAREVLQFSDAYSEAHLSVFVDDCRSVYLYAVGGGGASHASGQPAGRGAFGASAYVSIYDYCTGENYYGEGGSEVGGSVAITSLQGATFSIPIALMHRTCGPTPEGYWACEEVSAGSATLRLEVVGDGDTYSGLQITRTQGYGYRQMTRRQGTQRWGSLALASLPLDGVDLLAEFTAAGTGDSYGVLGRDGATSVTLTRR